MRLPRDLSGEKLCAVLEKIGYQKTRQRGSHVRLTAGFKENPHHITIPLHSPLKVATLSGILSDISEYLGVGKAELLEKLFAAD